MTYSDLYLRRRTPFSLVLVAMAILSVLSFSLSFFGSGSLPARATKKAVKRHEVVNISSTSVGIFWQSEKKEVGWVVYGDSNSEVKTILLDERDGVNKKTSSINHYVLINNLAANTEYFYKIVTNNETITNPNGNAFKFRTLRQTNTTTSLKPAYGKVVLPNGQPAQEAFVLYHYEGSFPLLTLTKTTGEWLVPLQYVVNKHSGDMATINDSSMVKIEILTDDESSVVTAPVKKTNPLSQTLILGKQYSFTSDEQEVLPASTTRTRDGLSSVDIIFPREGAIVPAVKPLLKGVAPVGKQVTLALNTKPPYHDTLTVDSRGEWKIELPLRVLPGTYVLTVTTQDEKNKPVTLKRTFSIAKSGEQVLGDATGTGKLTQTPTPTMTVYATATGLPGTGETNITPTPSELLKGGITEDFLFFASFAFILLGAGVLIVF